MAKPSPPEINVQLALDPSIWVANRTQPVSLRGLGRVILFLVFLEGASVGRTKMARVLWPGEPDEVAANRLRVSFTRLKAVIGDSLIADRNHVRLAGIMVRLDLVEMEARLLEALDEVDVKLQFETLKTHSESLRSTTWREFADLDTAGILQSWDSVCRRSIRQLMGHALQTRDWDAVDFVWEIMLDRGDMDPVVCERFLDASDARGDLGLGLRKVKRAVQEQDRDDAKIILENLTSYARSLEKSQAANVEFQTSHAQLLGSVLLENLERHAASLAGILTAPEVQFQMQSLPAVQLQILETIQAHLEERSPIWVDIQSARLSAYASLYDSDKVIEICQSLFPCVMTPLRASSTWMHYSFCMFQIRNWEEAIASIHQAEGFALAGGETERAEICRVTEAAYFWHLGRVSEARAIYDAFLEKYGDSEDFSVGVNAVIARANYAVIELVFGDIEKAKQHADNAYAKRTQFNLARLLPNLLSVMGVVYARTDEIHQGVDFAVEALKQTFARSSSREGQLNMEWSCGILVVGGLRSEAWHVMEWVNQWRKRTKHTRSVCEELFSESLGLQEFEGKKSAFSDTEEPREVMRFLIKNLRQVQRSLPLPPTPG